MMLHRVRLAVALLSVSSNGPALRPRCTDAWSSPAAAAAPGLRLVRRPSSSPSSARPRRSFVPRLGLLHGGPHSARRRARSPPLFLSTANDGDDDDDDSAAARAERLRALAARTRLEAERLESSFALEQIAKLEARLEKATTTTTTTDDSDTEEVRAKIAALKRRLDPQPSSSATAPPPSPEPEPEPTPAPETKKEEKEEEEVVDEELQLMIDGFTDLLQDYEEYMSNRTLVVELNEEDREALNEVKEVANAFGELFRDEEVAEEMTKEFREAFGEWVTASNSNATTTDVDIDGEVNKTIGSVVAFFDGMLTGANVTGDELEMLREVGGFLGGLKKFSNVSLAEEIKLSIEEDRRIAELSEADPTIVATIEALQTTFPRTAIDTRNAPDRNDVDRFLDELVRRDPTALELTNRKPRDALFGFRIDGVNRLDDGDALVAHLETTLERTDLTDKLQCFWMRLPVGGDELTDVQLADATTTADADAGNNPLDVLDALEETLNPPTLLVLGPRRAAPATKASDVLGSNALGIAAVAYFALSCLASADDGASTLESVVAGAARAPPLFGAILATQLLHEMGHFLAASVNKIELGFPAIVPWPWTGLLGGTTSFKSPPRNANALFDTAAAGPIAGMISSIAFLVVGLKLTLAADQDLLSNLPRLPLETLQQTSSLTSAIVESVMGFDVLSSLDPTSTAVPCHPLTIAGYVGIIANGLSFLPMVGSTDGGRMSRALFGKTDIGQGLPVLAATGFLLVQGFRGWGVSKLLLLYLFFCNVFYDEKDLPCINDVDKAGGPRCVIFLATSALAFVALSPVL